MTTLNASLRRRFGGSSASLARRTDAGALVHEEVAADTTVADGADPTTGGAAPHFDESTGQEGQTDRSSGSAGSAGEGAGQ